MTEEIVIRTRLRYIVEENCVVMIKRLGGESVDFSREYNHNHGRGMMKAEWLCLLTKLL